MNTIAYIAGQFPLRSETFVWREVRELRRRGWVVHTFGLHAPGETTPAELVELRESTTTIYTSARHPILQGLSHPITLAGAVRDGVFARESTSLRGRIILPAQASAGAWLGEKLRGLGVSHLHAHFAHAPTSLAMYAARVAQIPFSFTGHANDLFQRRQILGRKLRRAAFVSCISKWHADLYQRVTGRPEQDYPIIRCGVDTESWCPPESRAAGRPAPLSALTVCRLGETKGVDTRVRAMARLKQVRIDVRLTLAGDGPMRGMLQALVKEFSLDGRVEFAGVVESQRVREMMSRSDMLILPCRVDSAGDRDGIPVVLMEAMSCGLPVVAGNLPAIRELVIDEQTGLLVEGDNVDDTAAAIARLIADENLRRSLGDRGRMHIETEFSLQKNISRLEACFSRSIESARQ